MKTPWKREVNSKAAMDDGLTGATRNQRNIREAVRFEVPSSLVVGEMAHQFEDVSTTQKMDPSHDFGENSMDGLRMKFQLLR